MIPIILGIQAVLAVLVVGSIIMQSRGAGLALIGAGANTPMTTQRRGPEKVLFNATILFSVVFVALTVVQWYL